MRANLVLLAAVATAGVVGSYRGQVAAAPDARAGLGSKIEAASDFFVDDAGNIYVIDGAKVWLLDDRGGTNDFIYANGFEPLNLSPVANPQAQTLLEDAAPLTLTLAGSDPEGQPLAFGIAGGPMLGILGALTPVGASSASVTYTPNPNASGADSFTFRVNDGSSNSTPATVSLSITPVNDAPSFTAGANQTVNEDAGPQTVASWATAISAGPNEAGQALAFNVIGNTNPALFSAGPAVSSAGVLTYTPAANANGSASITLSLSDNGGTANGGVNSSAPRTFTITVNPVSDPPVAQNKNGGSVQANMQRIGIDAGLLTGVVDPDAGTPSCTPTFTVASITNGTNGTVSNVNLGAGTFDFEPTAGFTGTATVNYTVSDTGCPGGTTSAPATISFNVVGPVIWFVNTAVAAGNGTLRSPFNTLAAATAAMGGTTNQRIFVYSGTQALGTGVTLPADGWLVGQGVTGTSFDAVMGIAPPVGTIARPSIAGMHPTIRGTVSMNGNNANVRGVSIQPASGTPALQAALAGPFTGLVVGDIANITSVGARAVDLNNVSGSFAIRAVNASGTDIGINLSNVNPSSGSFAVTGNGGACSAASPTCTGGTISNVTDAGIRLSNARGVSLTRMRVSNTGNFGLSGTSVANLDLDTSLFDGTHGGAIDEGAIHVTNWTGTGTIAGSEILGGANDNIRITNNTGILNRLTISGSTIRNTGTGGTGNHGVRFAHACAALPSGCGNVVMNLTVTNSTFRDHHANHLDIGANGQGAMDVVLGNNSFQTSSSTTYIGAVNTTFDHGADLSFDYSSNTSTGSRLTAFNFFGSSGTQGGASLVGRFRNNVVGTAGVANSASAQGGGLNVSTSGGTVTLAVTGNVVRNYASSPGMGFNTGDAVASAGAFNLTAASNTITIDTGLTDLHQHGLLASMGNTSTGNVITACLDFGGAGTLANTLFGSSNPLMAGSELRVRQRFTSVVRLPGYGGASGDTNATVSFLASRNAVSSASSVTAAGAFGGGPACQLP